MKKDVSEEFVQLSGRIERIKCERVYYQDIVYKVCGMLDDLDGRHISRGDGIVCGCVSEPSTELQDSLKQFISQFSKMKSRISDLEGEIKGLKHKAETLSRERDVARLETKQLKSEIAEELEKMVCTEGEDAGVFFLSPESESKYDPKLNCHVYQHEHFSELGDALIGLWKLVNDERKGK